MLSPWFTKRQHIMFVFEWKFTTTTTKISKIIIVTVYKIYHQTNLCHFKLFVLSAKWERNVRLSKISIKNEVVSKAVRSDNCLRKNEKENIIIRSTYIFYNLMVMVGTHICFSSLWTKVYILLSEKSLFVDHREFPESPIYFGRVWIVFTANMVSTHYVML